ncbi:DNA polymerase III subunit gamma/tau [Histophilus somni]|uniref:DNA polymerase III subunit gamma/tau n=1 Tax=Histophilus somni TaxID=731 RepID=A0AAX2S341_HISSO|nr:DNA polymerase III subunit gamma/tau [Histophilus somni]QEH09197.1 DNA polymerase III subunit gamma/tau [Histophilus somni]QEH12151.1 DNA polymerase III subunit gamma/tau [Histophilus somni]QEH18275.1 DNA polymerase III subunit gamma/tau [Histophilus somni]QEH25471.1 DNA polymerase III subunit gamma/tau [Histophilus somni]QEH26631.1 DNA polymerase III subunit gamma/tau [Histophilus somni]
MSYQVLARKWRPKTFSEVVGQEHILTALSNGLCENRLHHAYLFSGTRGVGKTSIARLFAKGLNCIRGVTAEPCGECEHCKAIEEGRFIDLIEIDAASRTKVEDTRELLDNVQYKPTQGRYKVYLIDEVHMLSRHSFNALLKTLEEPPEYVKFLLATTDPQKLPITILSRCMQFHLKALSEKQIAQHLEFILQQENIPFEYPALEKLATAAQGSIRDSLSLTDQAIAMGNANVSLDTVSIMLGLLDDNQPIDILYALQQGNGEMLMKSIQAVAEKGADWDKLLVTLAEKLHQIAMLQLLPQQINEENSLGFLAKHITPEDVQFFYQVIVSGRKELASAPNHRIGAEMILLRSLAFHPKFISPSSAAPIEQSAVQKSQNIVQPSLVEMPVVSVAEQLPSQNLIRKPTIADKVDTKLSTTALSALEALEQLSQPSDHSDSEKKNSPIDNIHDISLRENTENISALPVLNVVPKDVDNALKTVTVIDKSDHRSDEIQEDSAENYRWEWRNPEMAVEEKAIRPSEIKQAILEQASPELIQRIIATAQERDDWTRIIEQLPLRGMTKDMALNTVLLNQSGDQIVLSLMSDKQHLLDRCHKELKQALSDFYQRDIQLLITPTDDKNLATPLYYQNLVYQEFNEQAKKALQEDNSLKLLEKEFAATLDLDSVRPI